MTTEEYLRERERIMGILKTRRKELGLTQRELSRRLAYARGQHKESAFKSVVSRWETGEVNPQMFNLIDMARELGLKVTFEEFDDKRS